MLWTENDAPVVSKAACGFATAEVRVQPPSGALGVMPPCCNGSQPSWYGGSVGSIPTGGTDGVQSEKGKVQSERRELLNSPFFTFPFSLCTPKRLVLPTARIPGCQPGDGGSIPLRAAVDMARSSNGTGRQVL